MNWRSIGSSMPGPRRLFGALIVVTGLLLLTRETWEAIIFHDPRVAQALLGGLLAAAATALGTVPMLVSRPLTGRTQDTLLGFGAGVMLAASAFSLIIPALAAAAEQGSSPMQAGAIVSSAVLLGAALLILIDQLLPHEHFVKGVEGSHARASARAIKRAWLFVFAICLHNFPEGLAIGVAFAGTDEARATALATGIAIQDVPEGLVVALALIAAGYSRATAAGIGIASGLIEPIGAVMGAAIVTLVKNVVSSYVERWNSLLGAIFIIVIMFMPLGIVPGCQALWRKWQARHKPPAASAPAPEPAE